MTARLNITVLTEDNSPHGPQVVFELVKKGILLTWPTAGARAITLEEAQTEIQQAMRANLWKGKKSPAQQRRTQIQQGLATALTKGFVAIHVDGDLPWSQSQSGRLGENLTRLKSALLEPLREALQRRGMESLLERLLIVVPFYSIEAWTYQNLAEVRRLLEKKGLEGWADLTRWEEDRTLIDEQSKIKDHCPLSSDHNLHLAQNSWPARRAYEARASFAHFVDRLKENPALQAQLGPVEGS